MCKYCEQFSPLCIHKKKYGFFANIQDKQLRITYTCDDDYYNDIKYIKINYCPKCGRKL